MPRSAAVLPIFLASAIVALSACDKGTSAPATRGDPAAPADPAPADPATPAGPATPATPETKPPLDRNTLRITVEPPPSPDAEHAAIRCALDGDPLDADYMHGTLSIAAASDGALYVSDPAGVRRYRAADGEACSLALDPGFGSAGVLAIPDIEAAPQTIGDGPFYMQSGGATWRLAAGPAGAVYIYDLLRGIHRVDRGKVESACALQGVASLVFVAAQAYINRNGGEKLALRGCKTTAAHLDPAPGMTLHSAAGALWGELDSARVARYGADGKAVATIESTDSFAPGGFCSLVALAACGDGICVVDSNCTKIERFSADATFERELPTEALFASRPQSLTSATTGPDATLWIAAAHKDGAHVEGAIYRLK
jgi:hypothetical protein